MNELAMNDFDMTEDHSSLGQLWRFLDEANATSSTNSTNSTSLEETTSESQVIRNTFATYGSALLIAMIIFCWLRLKYPKVYNIRSWIEDQKTPLASNQFGFFSWIWNIYSIPEHRMMEECGMDAVCFARLITMGIKLNVAGMVCSIFLMPLYATSPEWSETVGNTDRVFQITSGNVPPGSSRFIGTAVAAYVVFGYTMKLILDEFKWFIEMRHRFLMLPRPRNYAVYLRNIPEEFKSNTGIRRFFEISLGVDVLETHLLMSTPNLSAVVAKRDATLGSLERALYLRDTLGEAPRHSIEKGMVPGVSMSSLRGNGETVDSIKYYAEELAEQNKDVAKRIDDLTEEADSLQIVNSVESADYTEDNTDEEEAAGLFNFVKSNAVNTLSAVKDNTTGVVSGATDLVGSTANLAASLLTKNEDGERYSAGFVVFPKLTSVQIALQMIHHESPFDFECLEAPEPKDILWLNVGRSHKDLQVGSLIAFSLSAAICLLWTIPVAFVASLSSVEALRLEIGWIDDMLNKMPWLVPLFELLAPQFLVILNAALPTILEYVSLFEGLISSSLLETSLFQKLAAFTIIQTFFVSALSGSILEELNKIINDPTSVVDLLAKSLPQQASFFMQMTVVVTTTTCIMEGFRVVPLALALGRKLIGPNVTKKERQTTFVGLRPLADPDDFYVADYMSNLVLFFMIYLVYAVMAPLVSYILAFCLLVTGTLYRHQFVYIYDNKFDSGGYIWMKFIRILTTCLLIAEITIFGVLALKKAPAGTAMMVPLIIVTILFSYYIRQLHFRVAQQLPTRLCLKQDRKNATKGEMDYSFVRGAYVQPSMQKRQVFPDGASDRELHALGLLKDNMECHESLTATGIPYRVTNFKVKGEIPNEETEALVFDSSENFDIPVDVEDGVPVTEEDKMRFL